MSWRRMGSTGCAQWAQVQYNEVKTTRAPCLHASGQRGVGSRVCRNQSLPPSAGPRARFPAPLPTLPPHLSPLPSPLPSRQHADLLRFFKQHDMHTILVPEVAAAAAGTSTSAKAAHRGIKQSTNEVRGAAPAGGPRGRAARAPPARRARPGASTVARSPRLCLPASPRTPTRLCARRC